MAQLLPATKGLKCHKIHLTGDAASPRSHTCQLVIGAFRCDREGSHSDHSIDVLQVTARLFDHIASVR